MARRSQLCPLIKAKVQSDIEMRKEPERYVKRVGNYIGIATNIGLLIGIVLVVYELRANAIFMKSAVYQERTRDLLSIHAMVMESDELNRALTKIHPVSGCETESLNKTEQVAYRIYLIAHANRLDNLMTQFELGLIDEAYLRRIKSSFDIVSKRGRHQVRAGELALDRYQQLGFELPDVVECDLIEEKVARGS